MAVNANRFYLGYPGNMLMLPGQTRNSNPQAAPIVQGNPFVGLNGTQTLDRLSIKKAFQLSWDYLHESDFAPIDAIYHTMCAAKPRLLDLRHTNLLSRNISVGGSYKRSTSGLSAPAVQMNANSTFESGTSPWSVVGGSMVQSSALAHTGSHSVQVTPTAASGIVSEALAVTAGVTYTASSWLWFSNTVTSGAYVEILWFNSGMTQIGSTVQSVSMANGIWTQTIVQGAAPAGAAFAEISTGLNMFTSANIWYADDVLIYVTPAVPNFQTYTDLPSPLSTVIDGGIAWTPTASGQQLLSAYDETPTIPGSEYLLSAYVKAASGTVSLLIQPYDISGNALSATTITPVTLTGSWQRLVAPFWVPPATAATFAVGIQSTGTVQLNTTGWQLQIDTVGNVLASWLPGWGVPKIIMPELDVLYPYPGWVQAKLYVLEA